MGTISLQIPAVGQPHATEDVKVGNDLSTIQAAINGNLDATNLTVGSRRLAARVLNASAAAAASDLIVANTGGITVTLPSSPAANTLVGVINVSTITGASPTTIAGGGAAIYGGGFATLGTSFLLGTGGASVTLQFDGSNWAIISGQQDSGWVALSLAGGISAAASFYTPSSRLQGDTVRLKGVLTGSFTANQTVATIPTGMRPSDANGVFVAAASGGNINPPLGLDITSGGAIMPITSGGGIGLDGVTYTL